MVPAVPRDSLTSRRHRPNANTLTLFYHVCLLPSNSNSASLLPPFVGPRARGRLASCQEHIDVDPSRINGATWLDCLQHGHRLEGGDASTLAFALLDHVLQSEPRVRVDVSTSNLQAYSYSVQEEKEG